MTTLPVVSGAQCIAALQKLGYRESRTSGSHVRLVCPDRNPVTVPKQYELDRGTLGSILRTVKVSADDFIKLLNN